MQVLGRGPKPPLLHVVEEEGRILLKCRPERRWQKPALIATFVLAMMACAPLAWRDARDLEGRIMSVAVALCLVGPFGALVIDVLKAREPDVWVVNTRDGQLERNGRVQARFIEITRVYATHRKPEKECHEHNLSVQIGRFRSETIDDIGTTEADWQEYLSVGQLIARYAEVPFEEI